MIFSNSSGSNKILLFAYGSLKESKVQQEVFGRAVADFKEDLLFDFSLSEEKIENIYPIIVPQAGKYVAGISYYVNDEELKCIDEYEGDEYRRTEVKLQSGKISWVYIKA